MVIRTTISIVLCLAAAGCAYRPELAITAGPRALNGNVEPGATFIVRQQISDHAECDFVHQSDPIVGWPFNDLPDISDSTLGCGVRFGGGRRR